MAVGPLTKVFASITEVDGAGSNTILGLADTKIYDIVPTPGRVTIRGEALWDSNMTPEDQPGPLLTLHAGRAA